MSSSREQQRLETRDRLYQAALATFRRDGFAAARIDDIAREAGVSRGSFYFHFPTKEHVLLARMQETEEQILGEVASLPAGATLASQLAAVNASMGTIWSADPELLPELAGIALRYTADHMEDQEANQLRSALKGMFEAAAARGEIRAALPAGMLGDLYLGNLLVGLLAWYGNQAMDLQTVLEGVTWLFWNGTAAS